MVMDSNDVQTCFFDKAHEIIGVIHFAVSVGDDREIKTDLREAESRGLETLAVPKRLHDVKRGVAVHDRGCASQYADNFVFTETIEELTHPDGIVMIVGRECAVWVEHVGCETVYALCARFSFGLLTHHVELLGQVNDCHLHLGVMIDALHCPTPSVAPNIEQVLGMVGK